MHHFILQLEKNVPPDEFIIALEDFMSSVIDYHVYSGAAPLEYLFSKKSLLLEQLTTKIKHLQTNNHLFLVISE